MMPSLSTAINSAKANPLVDNLPFADFSKQLTDELAIKLHPTTNSNIDEEETRVVLNSVGMDLLVFLAASVLVTTVANFFGASPILGYLVVGAILGPHALNLFANQEAGVELGDFGILFLLFSEGLEVTKSRLQKLANYLPLGMAQISLTTGILTAALLGVARITENSVAPLLNIQDPIQACVLAVTGALSTSAFIFPVLKERGWEEEQSGAAATTILLLQDLLVAPLLVILPFLVTQGPMDYGAIGFLTAKATLGFGAVVAVGSRVLQRIFQAVSETRSSETFVALCLLVSAGMGEIAKVLGLTDTAGAFAAGVLLANTNYRAQIQADILPFKAILLGVFFMDAGSNFDLGLVLQQWPAVFGGAAFLILCKALTLAAATRVPKQVEPNRLPSKDAIRIAILLAGGGEFAFVVLALAEKLSILSDDVVSLLTAIILVSMGITPVLGDFAEQLSAPYADSHEDTNESTVRTGEETQEIRTDVAEDSVVVLGHGEIGRAVLRQLSEYRLRTMQSFPDHDVSSFPNIVAFSQDPSLVASDAVLIPVPGAVVLFGDGNNPEVMRSAGITDPRAVFVTYKDHNRAISATARYRVAYPDVPIYVRAALRRESRDLKLAGATEVIIEADELARSVPKLLKHTWEGPLEDSDFDSVEDYRVAASDAANIPLSVVDDLFELYDSLDTCATGLLGRDDIIAMFRKTKGGFVASDTEIKQMELWLRTTTTMHMDPLDKIEFCRLYSRAPDFVKASFGKIRDVRVDASDANIRSRAKRKVTTTDTLKVLVDKDNE